MKFGGVVVGIQFKKIRLVLKKKKKKKLLMAHDY